jgi:lysophospholipase L1-like esterase
MTQDGGRYVRVVCMGDSITFGQHIDPARRWTTHLEHRLYERFGASNVEIVNRGVSGETTRMGLERFPASVQNEEPDVVTIQFGMNDCNCWQTDHGLPRVRMNAFRENLIEMVERSRKFGAREVILATNPRTMRRTPMVSGEIYEEANARYSEVMREVAHLTESQLCDIQRAFADLDDRKLEKMLLPAPDLLHLSEEGNLFYANVISPYVERAVDAVMSERER